ncbi:hypothetical protein UA08_00184 [Talaromyces atroroseus]|uniref:NmrA-like domain-containing protein n=1 Tax=Talaromyces atroroseus TaxID=1441469 RepID=A0A225ASA0_TALAT|nr:hypothetical protein UA08_00184 [Talaromyces atroroseus]OKL63870.1 hypothetical protein UA08_00184 [Talaromyces atroroseus]
MATGFAKDQPAGSKNYVENIAVVGAGGQVGKFVVEALLANGKHKITALTREGSKNVIPDGVSIKKIDYANPSTIVEALKGQDVLVYTLAVTATNEAEILQQAAADAGVKWILPNEFGSNSNNPEVNKDVPLGLAKTKLRQHIEGLGVSSWIGIACGFWYEYSLSAGPWSYGFDIKNRAVTFYDDGTQRLNTSTWLQTARGVANLLALKVLPDDENDKSPHLSQFKNDFVYISSFKLNQQEIFESVLRVTGTTRDDWTITNQPVKERFAVGQQMLQSGNRSGFGLMLYSRMFYPDGPCLHPRDDNVVLGLPQEDLDERTAVAVKMVEEEYFEKHVVPRVSGN